MRSPRHSGRETPREIPGPVNIRLFRSQRLLLQAQLFSQGDNCTVPRSGHERVLGTSLVLAQPKPPVPLDRVSGLSQLPFFEGCLLVLQERLQGTVFPRREPML